MGPAADMSIFPRVVCRWSWKINFKYIGVFVVIYPIMMEINLLLATNTDS